MSKRAGAAVPSAGAQPASTSEPHLPPHDATTSASGLAADATEAVTPAAAQLRSLCPVANALDLLGDRWTLLVIRDLFAEKHRFGDFLASPERIPTNILADRLKRLER